MSGIADVSPDRFEHGTRARYVAGKCRCEACRRANREYARSRLRAEPNGLVDAGAARAHLLKLSAQGIGRRAVAAACDVALSVLLDVRTGRKTRVRAETARRILRVDSGAVADGALVSATETRRLISELRRAGLTKQEIAARLGSKASTPSLQLTRPRVRAVNALKVKRLAAQVRVELEAEAQVGCPDCGRRHDKQTRLDAVRPLSGLTLEGLVETFPCWYRGRPHQLRRDLQDLRAKRHGLEVAEAVVRANVTGRAA